MPPQVLGILIVLVAFCIREAVKMQLLGGLLFIVGLLSVVSSAHGYYGGWMKAHATFYGGGDASGTMGTYV